MDLAQPRKIELASDASRSSGPIARRGAEMIRGRHLRSPLIEGLRDG